MPCRCQWTAGSCTSGERGGSSTPISVSFAYWKTGEERGHHAVGWDNLNCCRGGSGSICAYTDHESKYKLKIHSPACPPKQACPSNTDLVVIRVFGRRLKHRLDSAPLSKNRLILVLGVVEILCNIHIACAVDCTALLDKVS